MVKKLQIKLCIMDIIIAALIFAAIVLLILISGCAVQSHIKGVSSNFALPDGNAPVEFTGTAADTMAKQIAANMQNEKGRIDTLFKYNSVLFIILFVALLGSAVFAFLTKSSWGWIPPTVIGCGLLSLVFITAAVEYIKYIVLGCLVVTAGVFIYKAVQYQKERNKNGKA